MTKYDTPAACPACDGSLAVDSLGHIYCMTHGAEDVPSWDEMALNTDPGFTVEVHPANRVLYVVEVSA